MYRLQGGHGPLQWEFAEASACRGASPPNPAQFLFGHQKVSQEVESPTQAMVELVFLVLFLNQRSVDVVFFREAQAQSSGQTMLQGYPVLLVPYGVCRLGDIRSLRAVRRVACSLIVRYSVISFASLLNEAPINHVANMPPPPAVDHSD